MTPSNSLTSAAPVAVTNPLSPLFRLMIQTMRETWGLVLALALTVAVFSFASPYFFSAYAFTGIVEHAAFTLILATGMTLVIATGGIDVSVGATLALSSMLTAMAMTAGVPVSASILIGLAVGALIGAINGTVISRLKLQPFIVTLAMLSLARGLTLIVSGGYPVGNLPREFAALFSGPEHPGKVVYFGFGVLLMTMFVMHRTRVGIYIRGIGGSEHTSHICGVRVGLVRTGVYVFQALLAVLAGFTFTASLDAAEPSAGLSTEWLEAIAAPIIGGNALAGGRARLFGTFLGCLLLATMRSGLNISGVAVAWQQVAIGSIIVGAVALDTWTRNRQERA
jgi:ribose/xylose/arabinose/galactoside ABC-type transport system permease subunit